MGYFIAIVLLFIVTDMQDETKIVLLDNNKSNNEIVIKSNKSTRVLNKSNSYITLGSYASKPPRVKYVSNEELKKEYGDLINYNKPVSILYYFKSGADELTNDSKKRLEKISEAMQEKRFYDITIIGHADRMGDDELNIKLSIKRSQKIAKWIRDRNFSIASLDIKSYGEMDLLIPTKDGVSEPKNRRVEVFIR